MLLFIGLADIGLLAEADASARNGSSSDSGNGESDSVESRVNRGGFDLTIVLGSGGSGGGA